MSKKEMKSNLKNILCGYRVFNASTAKKFKDLGFIVLRDKKHIILIYEINGKSFEFSMSKTASDFRAGYKQAGVIFRAIEKELA